MAGFRILSTKQTGFEHVRGVCSDALPHVYRDVWRMWRPDCWVRRTAQPPWIADSALTHPQSTSHGVQQSIITCRRFPSTTESAMTFVLYVPSERFLGAKVYWSVILKRTTMEQCVICLLYTSPSPRDGLLSRMPSSA